MITLLPFLPQDFDQLIAWAGSEEMLVQFAGPMFAFPLTHHQLENYLEDSNRLAYKVVLEPGNKHIGHAEIFLHDEVSAVFCRILIGDPQQRNKGWGQQIIGRLLAIAFNEYGLEKVSLNVYDWNIGAIKCYEKAGFVINPGHIRKQEVKGQVWNSLNMIITRDRWREALSH